MSKQNLSPQDDYIDREQTWIKHRILREYLEQFAHIIGFNWDVINYVDCFSGPWESKKDDYRDSSFAIALEELRLAKQTHLKSGKKLQLRCFFLEKKRSSFARLKAFVEQESQHDDSQIVIKNAALEQSIDDIQTFAAQGGKAFTFLFIDPTGWTGFSMEKITPLLRLKDSEVLINLMTGDIRRFIESADEATQESLKQLFGSVKYRDRVQGLQGLDKEDTVAEVYREILSQTGGYNYTGEALVLDKSKDNTRYRLVYATRNATGIKVFKKSEKKAMEEMRVVRAEADKRRSEQRTGQGELFGPQVLHESQFFDLLRARYLNKAKEMVRDELQAAQRMTYDKAWVIGLRQPLVWESDLKEWIEDWGKKGFLTVEGLKGNQKAPQFGENHWLVWRGSKANQ